MILSTEGAIYVIDTVEKILTRYPREGGDSIEDFRVSSLRKDGEPIPYLAVGTLRVGQPAQFVLQIRDDNVQTIRTTTLITAITDD